MRLADTCFWQRHFWLGSRAPSSAKPILKASWVQHFFTVQNATECPEANAHTPDHPQLSHPLFQGEAGYRSLADAARGMSRVHPKELCPSSAGAEQC